VPVLPSEAQEYFPNYEVPNHLIQQARTNNVQGSSSPNSAAAPTEGDANNEGPNKFDTGKGKKKEKSKQ